MIFGDCPYCGESFILDWPEGLQLPAFAIVESADCGHRFWEKFSRWDPRCWTLEEFEELFIVDEESKVIRKRDDQ